MRARRPRAALQAHRDEKAAEAAQAEREREAIIILKLKLSGPLRQRLREKAAVRVDGKRNGMQDKKEAHH